VHLARKAMRCLVAATSRERRKACGRLAMGGAHDDEQEHHRHHYFHQEARDEAVLARRMRLISAIKAGPQVDIPAFV
jgi:hypothetical protein